MRIDIIVSVLSKENNEIECADEEIAIKNAIGKTLYDMGYTKFAVAGGDMISGEIKNTVQKTTINKKEN